MDDQLLRIARQIMEASGSEGLTMRVLSQRARISVGRMYRRYGTKRDIIDAVRSRVWDELIDRAANEASRHSSFSRVFALTRELLRLAGMKPLLYSALLHSPATRGHDDRVDRLRKFCLSSIEQCGLAPAPAIAAEAYWWGSTRGCAAQLIEDRTGTTPDEGTPAKLDGYANAILAGVARYADSRNTGLGRDDHEP